MEIGQRVKILKGENKGRKIDSVGWVSQMDSYVGKIAVVIAIDEDGDVRLSDGVSQYIEDYFFDPEWLEVIPEIHTAVGKIVVNEAGQISLQNMDGNAFDIQNYVGKTIYIKEG